MNINGSYFKMISQLFSRKKRERTIMNTLLKPPSQPVASKRDIFVKSSVMSAATYTAPAKQKYISKDLMECINSSIFLAKSGDVWECNGQKFTTSQIPPINGEQLKEIKADNNVMDFGTGSFKYLSADGREHLLHASKTGVVHMIHTEQMRGAPHDETMQRYASFWRSMMSKYPEYIGLKFPDEEIKKYMSEAGVKPGFVTIKVAGNEVTQFYSEGLGGIIHTKERYDNKYAHLKQQLKKYMPGDVFSINEKKYVLSDSHTLDIPYGADIYNLKEPDNYKFGKRVE